MGDKLLNGGAARATCPPTVPSSACQASMKSWAMVSELGSVLAATFTVWPAIPPRPRSIAFASASPSVETGSAVLSTRSWSLRSATSLPVATGEISRTLAGMATSWATPATPAEDHGPVRQLALSVSTSFRAESTAESVSAPWSSLTIRMVWSAPTESTACLIRSSATSDAF